MEIEECRLSELRHFTPKQAEATERADRYQYHLYGGSRGPGKSYWLRWYLLREVCMMAKAGISEPTVGLFCEDYPSLKDRQISKIQLEFPRWVGEIKDSKSHGFGFYLHPKHWGGGMIALRNLDDPSKYQSSEFAAIGVDELTKNKIETFNILRGSLRWPGVRKPRFVAATNPGGIGHIWVRAYWIDKQFPPEMAGIQEEFAFTRALPDDNPHLDASYWETLDSLPPDLARAWRYGDWDVFEGQFFGELRREVHGYTGPPPAGETFVSVDYGESAPSAVYWCRVDYDGDVWVYRELYGPGMLYDQLAERIKAFTLPTERLQYVVTSPDIWQTSKGTGVVGAEVMSGPPYSLPLSRADDNRLEGWRHMKGYIHHNRLHVSLDACPNWWRTVPAMVYDQTHPEDMDGKGEDHCLVADTLVDTSRGPECIGDLVGATGAVWTPDGWAQYRNVRLTRRAQQVFTLTTEDGRAVTATGDHRIMTSNGDWCELLTLKPGDMLMDAGQPLRSCDTMSYHLTGRLHATDCHQRHHSGVQRSPVLPMRTILSAQGQQTAPRGLGVSQWADTRGRPCTSCRWQPVEQPARQPALGDRDRSSIPAHAARGETRRGQAASPGKGSTEGCRVAQDRGWERVRQAGLCSRQGYMAGAGKPGLSVLWPGVHDGTLEDNALQVLFCQVQSSSAASRKGGHDRQGVPGMRGGVQSRQVQASDLLLKEMRLGRSAVVKGIEPAGVADVYCMVVDQGHAFSVSGGLVVSNCSESTRYALMSRPAARKPVIEVPPPPRSRRAIEEMYRQSRGEREESPDEYLV